MIHFIAEAGMSTRILAIDAATEACSVALWNRGEQFTLFEICPRAHTQLILPMIQRVLSESQLTLTQLDAIAFGRGPGSFTGVRIGMGIAQGLALGAGLPMLGISTLATLAQGAYRMTGATQVLAAIDARMGELYWGEYQYQEGQGWMSAWREALLAPQQAGERIMQLNSQWVWAGTGWESYPELLLEGQTLVTDGKQRLPQAEDMLVLALHDWKLGKAVAVEESQPVYLRNEVIWKKLPGRG